MPPSPEFAAITPGDNGAGLSVISAGSCAAVLRTVASRRQPIQRVVLSATGDASAPVRSSSAHLVMCAAGSLLLRSAVRPLPPETLIYIAMLSPMIGDGQYDDRTVASLDLIAWARATLFAAHIETPPNGELPAAKVHPDRSLSVRRIVDLLVLSAQSEGLFLHLASADRPQ